MTTLDEQLRHIFETYHTIAVVGMSRNPDKPAYEVPTYLAEQGYTIYPVNPLASEIDGRPCYPSLSAVPGPIDIVEVFRPSQDALAVVEEAVRRHQERGDVQVIWLQLGIVNEAARQLAEAAGILFVQNRCMYADHVRLYGLR